MVTHKAKIHQRTLFYQFYSYNWILQIKWRDGHGDEIFSVIQFVI